MTLALNFNKYAISGIFICKKHNFWDKKLKIIDDLVIKFSINNEIISHKID